MEKRLLITLSPNAPQALDRGWISTPLGCFEFLYSSNEIAHLSFSVEKHDTTDYLDKKLKKWIDSGQIKIAFNMTLFQKRVYEELIKIDQGEIISYQALALKSQSKAVRAVGSAMARNQVALMIPCHRVIRKNGDIGSYAGGKGVKQSLLAFEQNGGSMYELLTNR